MLSFLQSVMNSSTSILFAAFGVLLMQTSGVMNIGAEGMMLIGAFSGVLGTSLTGNVWLGGLFAMAVTGLTGLVYGFFTITERANQVVVGIALNIFAQGITTTLYRIIFGMGSQSTKVESFPKLLTLSVPVYIGIVLIPLLSWLLYGSRPGVRIRAAGEYPQAVDAAGLSVSAIRYASTIIGSMIIGFGGAYLSCGELSFFTENMVTGRGYIALAAVIFGQYTPLGSYLAVLVFGAGEALTYKLQALGNGFPSQIILMCPYVLTVIAVAAFGQKSSGPSALGIPFRKEA